MSETVYQSEKFSNVVSAMARAQLEFPTIIKDCENPYHHNKYADINSILKAILPTLAKHDVHVTQRPIETDGESMLLETLVVHGSSGEWISSRLAMQPGKKDPQTIGSCITYARRYALQAMFNLQAEDDDGNKASSYNDARTKKEKERQKANGGPRSRASYAEDSLGDHANGTKGDMALYDRLCIEIDEAISPLRLKQISDEITAGLDKQLSVDQLNDIRDRWGIKQLDLKEASV